MHFDNLIIRKNQAKNSSNESNMKVKVLRENQNSIDVEDSSFMDYHGSSIIRVTFPFACI